MNENIDIQAVDKSLLTPMLNYTLHRGDLYHLSGPSNSGKTTMIQSFSPSKRVKRGLSRRTSALSNTLSSTLYNVSSFSGLPEDLLFAFVSFMPIQQSDLSDDGVFLHTILYQGVEQYRKNQVSLGLEDWETLVTEEISKNTDNKTFGKKISPLLDKADLLHKVADCLHAFPMSILEQLYNDVKKEDLKTLPKKIDSFGDKLQNRQVLEQDSNIITKQITEFWEIIVNLFEEEMKTLEKLIVANNDYYSVDADFVAEHYPHDPRRECQQGEKTFLLVFGPLELDKDVTSSQETYTKEQAKALVDEILCSSGQKEFLFSQLSFLFRGEEDLLRRGEEDETNLVANYQEEKHYNLMLVDAEGLGHGLNVDPHQDEKRIRNLFSKGNNQKIILVLHAEDSNLAQHTDALLKSSWKKRKKGNVVAVLFTHADSYFATIQNAEDEFLEEIDTEMMEKSFQEKKLQLLQRQEAITGTKVQENQLYLTGKIPFGNDFLRKKFQEDGISYPAAIGRIMTYFAETTPSRSFFGMNPQEIRKTYMNLENLAELENLAVDMTGCYRNNQDCIDIAKKDVPPVHFSTALAIKSHWKNDGESHEFRGTSQDYAYIYSFFVDKLAEIPQKQLKNVLFTPEILQKIAQNPSASKSNPQNEIGVIYVEYMLEHMGKALAKKIGADLEQRYYFTAEPWAYHRQRLYRMLKGAETHYIPVEKGVLTKDFQNQLKEVAETLTDRFVKQYGILEDKSPLCEKGEN